jgi:hypothetical protein
MPELSPTVHDLQMAFESHILGCDKRDDIVLSSSWFAASGTNDRRGSLVVSGCFPIHCFAGSDSTASARTLQAPKRAL